MAYAGGLMATDRAADRRLHAGDDPRLDSAEPGRLGVIFGVFRSR